MVGSASPIPKEQKLPAAGGPSAPEPTGDGTFESDLELTLASASGADSGPAPDAGPAAPAGSGAGGPADGSHEAEAALLRALPALSDAQRERLGLRVGESEVMEHAMWGAAERFMGMRSSGVSYERRSYRCRVELAAPVFEFAPGSDGAFVAGLALPLGWKAQGFVRRVEFGGDSAVRGWLRAWSLMDTRDERVPFDGSTLDFYAAGFADARVRDVLAANGSAVSSLVHSEYAELHWDSYARRVLYVWFAEPVRVERVRAAAPLCVAMTYYRAVFESEDEE